MVGGLPEYVNMIDQKDNAATLAAIELFYFAYRSFTSRPDQILARRGLGRVHHRILYFVARHPGMTVSQLIHTLQVSKQALNAPLRQLTERGLVSANTADHDRRVKELALTEKGQQLEEQLTATQVKQMYAAFNKAGKAATGGWQKIMRSITESEK